MSTIFISHSSHDDDAANRVRAWLEDLGHGVFLDFDLNRGIVAGGKWEEVLYRHLKACKAVVVLCSRSSMDSKWCFMEITHARALGKPVFPLKIDDCELDGVLDDTQLVDMTRGWAEGFRRLERDDGVRIDDELRRALPTALEALAEHYYLRAEPRRPGLANHLYRCAETFALEHDEYGERNVLTLIIQRRRARFLIEQQRWSAARDLRRRLVASRSEAMSRLSPLESSIISDLEGHLPGG